MLVYKKKRFFPKEKQHQQKTPKQMERHFKGVANHRRIEILLLVSEKEGITLDGICEELKRNVKTISEHTKKLVSSGLMNKNHDGRGVHHSLSPYGKNFIKFIKSF
jgi:DNA-binding MarR family transcriptional regulator